MSKGNYTHVQELFPEIEAMLASGKTQREVAEYFKQEKNRIFFPEGFAWGSAGFPAGFRAAQFLLRKGNRCLKRPRILLTKM